MIYPRRFMTRLLNTLLDYLLWPTIIAAGITAMSFGFASGHGPTAFYITYLCMAFVIWGLEYARPHEREWQKPDGQMLPDLAHTLLTKIMVQVTVVSLVHLGIVRQFSDAKPGGIWPSQWPMAAQVLLGLAVSEFGLYWAHRIAHEWMPLWRFHSVHHSSRRLWFFNTGRFHFVDTLKSMVFGAPMVALSGAPGEVLLWGSAITAFVGILTHCNVEMRFGWLSYLFNTPELHRWHHSMDLREGNKNYGENLVIWDMIFGTYFRDENRRPPVEIGIHEALPKGFIGQLVAPFRWRKYQAEQAALKAVPKE
jgi:sterol desaturase/sphingolipid hydroxylase (fatty acid hydroxylase superfamily)